MSLREEMWKYEQITGESAEYVPIIKLGAFLDGYEMGLKALEQKWISVSERLPKENGHYLVQTEDGITIMEYTLGNPHYHENPAFVSDVLGRCNGYVVAWMPLPKPYQGGEQNE